MDTKVNTEKQVRTTKETYKQIYEQYCNNNTNLPDSVKINLDLFISNLNGKDVLDVGCAGGRESKYMLSKGLNVTGCDFLEEFIQVAKATCPEGKFVVADMRSLPFEDKSFDGLWASASFLHIPKSDALITLKGFNRVLRAPDGILYLSVMMGNHDGLRVNAQMNWGDRQFSDYSKEELTNLLKEAGFSLITASENKTNWGPTFLHRLAKKLE